MLQLSKVAEKRMVILSSLILDRAIGGSKEIGIGLHHLQKTRAGNPVFFGRRRRS
jgi:hypothetical protein